MDFQALIQSYLHYCFAQNRLAKRSLKRYEYLLSVFQDFLIIENQINSGTLVSYLNGITPEEIFRSLRYYIDRSRFDGSKTVKSEDTARLYVSVVREFFRYQNMTDVIQSSTLIQSFGLHDDDTHSFAFKYNEELEQLYKIGKIVERNNDSIPTEKEIADILECCNQNLSLSEINRLKDKKAAHNRFVKALATKLILLTGAKVTPTIKSIKVADLDLSNGTINLGNYKVHLPFMLRLQFTDYMKICLSKSEEEPLFRLISKSETFEPNDIVTFFAYRVQISSIKSLAKYTILEMIDAGLDKDTILEFTGYGQDVYKSCKEISDLDAIETRSQHIDHAIKCLPLFDVL